MLLNANRSLDQDNFKLVVKFIPALHSDNLAEKNVRELISEC